jgi:hypothetical protein
MPRRFGKSADGFYRVEGQGDDIYYGSEETAARVAAQLDAADKDKAAAASAGNPARPAVASVKQPPQS